MYTMEMTIADIGNLLISFIKKTDQNFERLEDRFEGLENKVEGGFDSLDRKIDSKIDELAEATARGFVEVHNRIDVVEQTVGKIDTRLTGVEYAIQESAEQITSMREDVTFIKDHYVSKEDFRTVQKLL